MGRIYVLVFSQVLILVAYSVALTQLSRFRSHAMVFASCCVLSVSFLWLVLGMPYSILEWDMVVVAEVGLLIGVPSLTMLLGSLATWTLTRNVLRSAPIQILVVIIGGFVALILGGLFGILLSLKVGGGFHI